MDEAKALEILKKYMIDDLILLYHKDEAGEMIITYDEIVALLYIIGYVGYGISPPCSTDESFYYNIMDEMDRLEVKDE